MKDGGLRTMKEISFEDLDPSMENWLARCAVGRLKESFDLSLMQFRLGQDGILVRFLKVGDLYCFLSFLEKRIEIFM